MPKFLQLADDGTVRVKQRQFLQIDDILTLNSVTFCQDGHTAADIAAGLLYQSFQCLQAFTGVSTIRG